MKGVRKTVKRFVESSDSEDDIPLKKLSSKSVRLTRDKETTSSSESDIENYLQPFDKIDLNSSFFRTRTKSEEFNKIEQKLFHGITRLSDSESVEDTSNEAIVLTKNKATESKQPKIENIPTTGCTKLTFEQLQEYTKQIEEAKKQVEKYNAKKKIFKKIDNMDISNLLAVGESKKITLDNIKPEDLHSSDFESCDSEREDWEEIKLKDSQEAKENSYIGKKDIQIVVDMPNTCRKKNGLDLLAAMKRRLNRIRKENQVYVHKVHLLCWIAHGNYVNEVINNSEILGLALSLLPSDKCYPSDRTDLNYLEQIVQWYKNTMRLIEKPFAEKLDLMDILQLQINTRDIFDKKIYVYIFIAILRALGILCRLVLSFQVEPLRPPASELHSLSKGSSAKSDTKTENSKNESKTKQEKILNKNHVTKKPKVSEKCKIKTKMDKASKSEKHETSGTRISKNKSNAKSKQNKNEANLNSTNAKNSNPKNNTDQSKNGKMNKEKDQQPGTSGIKKSKKVDSKIKNKEKSLSEILDSDKNMRETRKHKAGNLKSREIETTLNNDNCENVSQSNKRNPPKKEVIKVKFSRKAQSKKTISQVDGTDYASDEDVDLNVLTLQLDGADDDKRNSDQSSANKDSKKKILKNTCKVKKHSSKLKSTESQYNSEDDFRSRSPPTKKNLKSSKLSQSQEVNLHKLNIPATKEAKLAGLRISPKKQLDVKSDIMNLIKGRIIEQKYVDRSRKVKKRKPEYKDTDSDSDFMQEPIKKKYHDSSIDYFINKPKVKQRIKTSRSESEQNRLSDEHKAVKKGNSVWAEVFLESEEKWISVDVVHGQVHCVNELFTRATHPVSYIVAWDNNNSIKDVTKRYCKNFNTITRKLRIDFKWWDETLKPFLGKYTSRDKEEDDDLNRQQLDQPLPKSIAEYKNHPLYALRRHLLKFEEIYPPDSQPLGFVRGEAVYPRNCVYICRSRDIWLKEAKVVKPGEQPYKIVKARPKYDKLSNKVITDQLLEIFGEWQTMDYEPPTAENGVVPRNAFGNVELFKTCMLPKGTVHLKLPGLNKVCRKMNIDCASAIVGFDFHGGWSHPTYDGFVVCEEFAAAVIAAWEQEQDEIERKENEKVERRVYTNWKKLIKGLQIRERLKNKYDFGEGDTSKESKQKKHKGPKFCTKKR